MTPRLWGSYLISIFLISPPAKWGYNTINLIELLQVLYELTHVVLRIRLAMTCTHIRAIIFLQHGKPSFKVCSNAISLTAPSEMTSGPLQRWDHLTTRADRRDTEVAGAPGHPALRGPAPCPDTDAAQGGRPAHAPQIRSPWQLLMRWSPFPQ